MPTSGTTVWTLTARDVVTAALRDELAVVDSTEEVSAESMTFGLFHLNALLRKMGGQHLETSGTVTVPAGDESGTLPADVDRVVSARISSTYERPLVRFERDEYLSLPNKDASGDPTCFFVSNQTAAVTMYVWPVPTTDTTIKIDYLRKVETVTDASETLDFPEEHQGTLVANLATRCAGRFRVSPNELPELFNRAAEAMREFEDAQRPASYMLGGY